MVMVRDIFRRGCCGIAAAALCCALVSGGVPLSAERAWAASDELSAALYNMQFNEEDVGYSYDAAQSKTACSVGVTLTALPCALQYMNQFSYVAYDDPATGARKRAAVVSERGSGKSARTTWLATCDGLRPNTSYSVRFYGVYLIDGEEVCSSPVAVPASTLPLSVVAPKVTKLSSKAVRVTLDIPQSQRRAKSFVAHVYAGGKEVRSLKTNGSARQAFTYKAKGAAKKKYSCRFAWTGDANASVLSKSVKPKANKRAWKRPSSAKSTSYKYGKCYVLPTKLSYDSSGRLVAKVVWVNKSLAKQKAKIKARVTVKVDGKKIASQTFTSKAMSRVTAKKATLKFKKAKKLKDLAYGNVEWCFKAKAH